MTGSDAWVAELLIAPSDAAAADRLFRVLGPEAAREVPRARALLERPTADSVRLRIGARDTGALRAALNTYLGWVELAGATERVASDASR